MAMRDERAPGAPLKRTKEWMAYIDTEVAAVCRSRGWGHQIRRKWSVREKPVSDSTIDDYEWKLILEGAADTPEPEPSDFDEGIYFVLGYDSQHRKFILQHDTEHCGDWGDHMFTCTYTELHLHPGLRLDRERVLVAEEHLSAIARSRDPDQLPPEGWLQRLLMDLTAKFGPNHFSIT
jgi:hypothetical protein